jgi:hypothetical protein
VFQEKLAKKTIIYDLAMQRWAQFALLCGSATATPAWIPVPDVLSNHGRFLRRKYAEGEAQSHGSGYRCSAGVMGAGRLGMGAGCHHSSPGDW